MVIKMSLENNYVINFLEVSLRKFCKFNNVANPFAFSKMKKIKCHENGM